MIDLQRVHDVGDFEWVLSWVITIQEIYLWRNIKSHFQVNVANWLQPNFVELEIKAHLF